MKTLQILGPGCPRCKTLADRVDAVARDLGLDYCLTKVTDILEISRFGVLLTPALVVDGVVKSMGKVLNQEEIKQCLVS